MSSTGPVTGELLAEKYRIERVLGRGGMGAVVAAHHVALDQRVAIKYLLPEALKVPEIVERFAREARAAAKIQSEHVARVIDVGRFADGAPYIVMEYLEGTDLAQLLHAKKGPLDIEDTVRYVLEACEALAEAHVAKIVHRDLKPSNLFLANRADKRAIVKVLDFGISKVVDSPDALTKTAGLLGTAYYMSPEQLTSPKLVDHRADIWALGTILHELLSGSPPFMGETFGEIGGGIIHNDPEPISARRPEIPPGLDAVVARCLAKKPDARYPSVAALAGALEPYAAPADRHGVDVIRRVLDEAAPMSLVMKDTLPLGAAAPALGPPPGTPPPRTSSAPPAPEPGTALPASAMTAAGLASSAATTPPAKRSALPLVLGGAVTLVCLGVVGSFLGRKPVVEPTAHAVVATEPAATVSVAPVASAEPSAAPVVSVSAAPPASAPSFAPVARQPRPAASHVASAAPPPPSASSPPAPKDPLKNMDIK